MNILILISIVSLILTLAVSNSALWAVESAKGAWMPTFIVHSNSQTVPDKLGIHRSLRMRWLRGSPSWRMNSFRKRKTRLRDHFPVSAWCRSVGT